MSMELVEDSDGSLGHNVEGILTNEKITKADEKAINDVKSFGDFSFLNGKTAGFKEVLEPLQR